MPTHRRIKILIVSQLELQLHPEFPHPESSQFTFRSPDSRKGKAPLDWTPPSASTESKADRLLGRQSVVSVYIPSIPSARFWIRYNVEAAATHSEWYYFKLFMNGRHITSWGTNAKSRPRGQVMRGLFEPSERWNYKHDGAVFKNMGTEARPFIFGREEKDRTAADDGGLIEVMVFRARGRKRTLPKPADFKEQDGYGIVMPSGGLLEKPEDAKCYDWHLKDPKDSPFATFKFHYRSWDSLTSLNLIPDNYPRTLLPASPSILSMDGDARELQTHLDLENEKDFSADRASISSNVSSTPWMTDVFDASPDRPSKNRDKRSAFVIPPDNSSFYSGRRSPDVPQSRFSAAVIDKPTSPKESPWKNYLNRPLPEVPIRQSSLPRQKSQNTDHSRSSSGVSSVSNPISITPSLLSHIDGETLFPETLQPEPFVGVAQMVQVSRSLFSVPFPSLESSLEESPSPVGHGHGHGHDIGMDNELPIQSVASKRQAVVPFDDSPLASMTNIAVRTRRSPGKRLSKPPPVGYNSSPSYSPCPAHSHIRPHPSDTTVTEEEMSQPALDENSTALSVSESEWMCRTPSPVSPLQRESTFSSPERLWSPTLGKRSSRQSSKGKEKDAPRMGSSGGGGSALKKKAKGWYTKVTALDDSVAGQGFAAMEDKSPGNRISGNWI